MKRLLLLIFGFAIVLSSCSKISDKPVSEKLSTDELSIAIKIDTSFASFYESIRKNVDEMDDIKKAKYNDVTYQRLFEYIKYLQDTTYWKPLNKNWEKEWEKDFGIYSKKADSTLTFWKKYLEENSLDKYVKIELAEINQEYYDYIGELKEVRLGFRLIPMQGKIEQIRFKYRYKAKINGDKYYETHDCILTSPFSAPIIRYWEVGYSEKDYFEGKSVETFLRDYNLQIEITSIRKNGVNISTDYFNVPEEISDYFKNGENDDFMRDYYKDIIIKKILHKNYLRKWEYTNKKADEIREKEDKLCFDFLNELYK